MTVEKRHSKKPLFLTALLVSTILLSLTLPTFASSTSNTITGVIHAGGLTSGGAGAENWTYYFLNVTLTSAEVVNGTFYLPTAPPGQTYLYLAPISTPFDGIGNSLSLKEGGNVFSFNTTVVYWFGRINQNGTYTLVVDNYNDVQPYGQTYPFTLTYSITKTPTFSVTIINGATGQTIASTPYKKGSSVVLDAPSPPSNYTFAGWVGTGPGSYSGPLASTTITVNGNITETATYRPFYSLDITYKYSNGTIIAQKDYKVVQGQPYTLSALNETYYSFDGWVWNGPVLRNCLYLSSEGG